jgi:hypothetical protein
MIVWIRSLLKLGFKQKWRNEIGAFGGLPQSANCVGFRLFQIILQTETLPERGLMSTVQAPAGRAFLILERGFLAPDAIFPEGTGRSNKSRVGIALSARAPRLR